MAGFKKKLPMSAALRQGGEGTVAPPKPGAGGPSKPKPTLGVSPKVSAGIPKLPSIGKMPKFK